MPVEIPSFSGKYAPNGRSQDDGKDNTADHDHDLLPPGFTLILDRLFGICHSPFHKAH